MNHLLAGNNSFLKEEALEKIKKKLFAQKVTNIEVEQFDAQEHSVAQVLDIARTWPLFSSQKLVVLHKVNSCLSQAVESLLSYLKNPLSPTTLVLVTSEEKISSSWLESFKEFCQVQVLDTPYESQLESWIIRRVQMENGKIEPQAARLLKEFVGTQVGTLVTEIHKLITYIGERTTIRVEDVESLVAHSIHYAGFALADAMGDKNLSKSLEIVDRMIGDQKTIPEIIGMMTWQIQRMIQAKQKLEHSWKWQDIATALKIKFPFLLKKFQSQLSKWELRELEEVLENLLQTDVLAKMGIVPARWALEEWLIESCTGLSRHFQLGELLHQA